jgi:hypothetical protein
MLQILKRKIDTSGYDFTQPVIYRRKKVAKR